MPTQARSAYSTQFKIGTNIVPEVVNIDGLGSRADLVDVSAHDGSGYSSEVTTIKRNNPITVTMNYINNNTIQDSLKAQYDAGSSTAYSIVLPGTPTATIGFNATVSQWQFNPLAVNAAVQIVAIFNPDGPITIT